MRTGGTFFLLPSIILILTITIFPLAYAFYTSFTNAKFGSTSTEFIGIRNYELPFTDYRFYNSITVTLLFSTIAPLIQIGFGIALALLMMRDFKFRNFFRALFLFPMFTSEIAVALMGQVLFYEGGGGPINGILKLMGLPEVSWRSVPSVAFWTLILVDTWQWTPFAYIITLAGLQALPKDMVEAALVDGASKLKIFRHITLPFLAPILLTIYFFRLVDTMRLFEIPFTLFGGGGPGITTETLTVYIYKTAFRGFFFGQAAAQSVIFLIIVLAVTILLVRRVRRFYVQHTF